jgi:hypothetical protein
MKTSHRLAAVALAGALLSAGCFSGAYALATANDSGSTDVVSREIPWDGSTGLSFDVPAVVRYVQAPGAGTIVARGPQRSIATLQVADGHIHDELLRSGSVLEITVTAPAVTRFILGGRSRLSIDGYDQPSLSLTTEGTAFVEVAGRSDQATIDMQGGGTVNLSRLNLQSLKGTMRGASTLVAAPERAADLDVRNVASAVLLSQPPDLKTALVDAGRVINADQLPARN